MTILAADRVTRTDDGGLFFVSMEPTDRVQKVWIEAEDDLVALRFEMNTSGISEAGRYLTAREAMAFAKAFERCAIAALKNGL